MSNYPDDFRADHPASPYALEFDYSETPTERFAAAALRLESLCGLLNEVWDQHADIAGGCGGDELAGEMATAIEAALAPLRSRIETFIVNCEINTRIEDDRSDAVFQRGFKALNALTQGRAA